MNKFTSTWAVVVSVIILLALKVYNPIPLQTLQLKTFDLYQKFGNNYQSKSLVLIDISDNSLNLYGQWPWKRDCLLYTSPSPRDRQKSRMPSSA